MTACPHCADGQTYDVGYGFPARICETCEGSGEIDHICPGDRVCPECRSVPLTILHRGMMGLTETIGDPLKSRRAA